MRRMSTLGITKFSGRDELKFKHLYDIVGREKTRANEMEGEVITLKNNFRERATWVSKMEFFRGLREWILSWKKMKMCGMRRVNHII